MAERFQEYRIRLQKELLRLAPGGPADGDPEAGSIALTRPPRPEMGDLALPVFPLARKLRRPPAQVASAWAASIRNDLTRADSMLRALDIPVLEATAAGPYVNLKLDPERYARLVLQSVVAGGERYGSAPQPSGRTVMVEYSSPNTNKPLHLGHVRNNLLGMSLGNLLEAAGDRVIRVSLVNDRGVHICKSMLAYRRWGRTAGAIADGRPAGHAEPSAGASDPAAPPGEPGSGYETPASTGEKGDHFVGRYYVLYNAKLAEERAAWAAARGIDLARFTRAALRAVEDAKTRQRLEAEGERLEEEFLAASELEAAVAEMLRLWEAGDAETLRLWRLMNEWVYAGFRQTYERLGCRFDRWYFESDTWRLGRSEVERGLRAGVFYRREDGSVWARLEPLGLQDKLLIRSDGTTVYITQDIGTAILRFQDYPLDRLYYVVGAEQEAHFRNLFAILKLLGHEWADRCVHATYAMVTLPRGLGKLKSREGKAVDADDLLDELHALAKERIEAGGYCETPETIERTAEEIGQGALKLYVLEVGSEKTICFDPEATISLTGDTGPAVQYSHARIHGIVRKGREAGLLEESDFEPEPSAAASAPSRPARRPIRFLREDRCEAGLLRQPEEREVLRRLAEFPDAVEAAARQISPALVANALLDLTKAYARMYHEHEVLKAAPGLRRARAQLALCVAQVLRNGLALLTIEAPERM